MNMMNPYNYNLPVEPDMFFGRQEIAESLAAQLLAVPGDSIGLIGGRRMGKTSLLEALLRLLELPSVGARLLVLPVFLDLSGEALDSVPAFFQTVAGRAYESLRGTIPLPPIDSGWGSEGVPAGPRFGRLLEDWNRTVLTQRGLPLRVVVLLDECEQIVEQAWAADLYGVLRALLVGRTTRGLLKVVMAGSHGFLTQVRQHGSPLRNALKYQMLEVLAPEANRALIIQPAGGQIPEPAAQAVADQSGGHPFLTQYLMHHIWQRDLRQATADTVLRLAAGFPHERNDFRDWAVGLGESGMRIYQILAEVDSPLAEPAIRTLMYPTPPDDLAQALDALSYHGLVVRTADDSYRVAGQMFRTWVQGRVASKLPRAVSPAVAVPPSPAMPGEPRFAAVIGINYSTLPPGILADVSTRAGFMPLQFAEADADAMANLLREQGYQVVSLLGATATRRAIIEALNQQSRAAGADHLLLVYFAGHGAVDPDNEDIAYLLPADADPDILAATAIPLEDLAARLLGKVRTALTLLDCCHSGYAVGLRGGAEPANAGRLFAERAQNTFRNVRGRIVLTACAGNQLARELVRLHHGAFTYYMLDWWRQNAEGDDFSLASYVATALNREGLPAPVRGGVQEGRLVLREPTPPTSPPAAG
jgi:hypothetical protein